jgi:Cu(I)/Ag(I) efflux system membrane protein CusA/SilA
MLKSENARLSGWIYVDLHGRDLRSAVREMQSVVARDVKIPPGYSIAWSGQFEFLERATQRLKVVVPATLVIIFVLLYLAFRRVRDAALILATLPFALAGGFWLMYLLGYNMSIASAVGFIALGGVASEIGVVMLVYINDAVARRAHEGRPVAGQELVAAIVEGAALRVRPVFMTVAVIIGGLLPIMWGSGTGSEVMRRIAAPMVGGMVTATVLTMIVVPAAYLLVHRPWRRAAVASVPGAVKPASGALAEPLR